MKQMSSWLAKGKFNEKDEYYTPPILVKPIIFEHLEHNNTKEQFTPSKIYLTSSQKNTYKEKIIKIIKNLLKNA